MMPNQEDRVRRVEGAVLALAEQVFAAFDESKVKRKGGQFSKSAGPKVNSVQKKQIQSTVAAEQRAKLAKKVADTHTTIRGQNALPAKKAEAAKKGAAKKAAAKPTDEKKFMEERAASAKAAADKAAEVAAKAAAGTPPTVADAQAVVNEAQLMLDKAKADTAAGSGTTAADVVAGDVQMDNPDVEASEGFAGATLSTEQAAAMKSVVQGYLAKESSGEPGAKQAAMAASWASAAAIKGGPILQKVQDERDRMDAVANDKKETELRRAQARAISQAYKDVLKNVDY